MLSWLKIVLFSILGKIYRFSYGTKLGKIPGSKKVYNLLLQRAWSANHIMEIQGSKMLVNPDELPERFSKTFRPFVFLGGWEEVTTNLFKDSVKEGDTVVDLGANMGYFTLLASGLVGKAGRVYAFEPEPVNYRQLLKNIELNGYENVVPLQKAVSNVNGKVKLFVHATDSGRHVIEPCNNDSAQEESIEIESVTLDEFFRDKPLPTVIKMDIEGAELLALFGMEKMIKSSENLKIFTEFYPSLIERAGYSTEEFARKLFAEWQFSVMVIDDYSKSKKFLKMNNAAELATFVTSREIINLLLEKTKRDLPI